MDSDNSTDPPKSKTSWWSTFAAKEWIGFSFSAIALCISAASFYLSNLRVEDNALVRIVDFGENDSTQDEAERFLDLRVIFMNAGNRPALVLGSTFWLSGEPDMKNRGGSTASVDKGLFPLLLKPRDIRIVEIRMLRSFLSDNIEIGTTIEDSQENGAEPIRRLYTGFEFTTVDSRGVAHVSWTGPQLLIEMSGSKLKAWGPAGGVGSFSIISLFPSRDLFGSGDK